MGRRIEHTRDANGKIVASHLVEEAAAKAMRDEEMLAEIEDFIEGFNQPTYRGMRIQWGPGPGPVWSSQRGRSGL